MARGSASPKDIRRACYQALLALEHFHALKVVHSDVKPQNIFIDDSCRAFLGDVDVSVDMATRISSARIQATKTKVSFTQGYEAPEIMNGATEKTDIFAFGKTLQFFPELQSLPARDALADRMTMADPRQRPTATESLQEPFFAECAHNPPEQRGLCIICFAEKPLSTGIVCGRSHFVCKDDLNSYAQEELNWLTRSEEALQRHRDSQGRLPCPACKPFVIQDPGDEPGRYVENQQQRLAQILHEHVYARYLAARDEAKEREIWEKLQDDFQQKLRGLKEEFEHQNVVRQAALEADATREFLRRSAPDALQCPQCGLGPVIPEGCENLQTHHGEARGGGRISNACRNPQCGPPPFFSRARSDWHRWDGTLR